VKSKNYPLSQRYFTSNEVENFWSVYSILKRPGELGNISDYHVFKDGIRPIWEDNLNGGKWIVIFFYSRFA
jgi:translation initiation factor 4E